MAVLPPASTRKRAVSSGTTEDSTRSKRSKQSVGGHLEGGCTQGGEVTSSFVEAAACNSEDKEEEQAKQLPQQQRQQLPQQQLPLQQQQQQQQQRQQQGNMQAQGWKAVPTASTPHKASSQPSHEGQQQQQRQQTQAHMQALDVSSLITSAPRQQRSHGGERLRTALHQQQQQSQPQQQQPEAPAPTATMQADAQRNSVEDDQDLDDLPRRPTQAAAQGGSVVPPQIVLSSCRAQQPGPCAEPAGPDSVSAASDVPAPSHSLEHQHQQHQQQSHAPLPSFFTTTLFVNPATLPPLPPHAAHHTIHFAQSHEFPHSHNQPRPQQQQQGLSTGACCTTPFGSPQQQQQPNVQQDSAQDSGATADQQQQQLQGEGQGGSSLQLGRRTTAPEAVEHDLAPQAAADATDVDEDEYMVDFDPLQFIRSLPPLDQVVSPFRSFLLPRKTRQCKQKTIVLDLDETLVHSSLEAPAEACDFSFPVFFNNQEHTINVKCRPHLQSFMERVAELFEVVVFTASQKIYAEHLLNILDPTRKLIKHRIYRDACVVVEGNYLKDLSVLGRDLKDTFIIDNSPQAFGFQVDNGIPIESWYSDDGDEELLRMLPFLESLAEAEDVRPAISARFRLRELVDNAPGS